MPTFTRVTTCCICSVSIPSTGVYCRLNPCGCVTCPGCLLKKHSRRGARQLVCECKRTVKSHQIFKAETPSGESIVYPTNDTHPIDSLRSSEEAQLLQSYDGDGSIMILYCGVIQKRKTGRMNKFNVTETKHIVSLNPDTSSVFPASTHERLGAFFGRLHNMIIPPSTAPHGSIPTMKPRELLDHALDNPTLLMACIHGLATGLPKVQVDNIIRRDYQDYQSQFLSLVAAHDLIIRCSTSYPLHFQLAMGDQIQMQQVSKQFQRLLSAFRLPCDESQHGG